MAYVNTGSRKKIVILGGGLSGLAAADKLCCDHDILILERANFLGGLASSFQVDGEWVPRFNHHIVKSNTLTLRYLERYGLMGNNVWQRINMAIAVDGTVYNINKILKFAQFNYLSLYEKFRFGLFGVYSIFLMNPGKIPDNMDAQRWLEKLAGKRVTQKIYYQLYGRNKFNIQLDQISAKQFAHRIKEKEFYDFFTFPEKGIQGMIDGLEGDLRSGGCTIVMEAQLESLDLEKKEIMYEHKGKKVKKRFDIIINTIPVPELLKFAQGLPESYIADIKRLRYTPVVGLCFGTTSFIDPFNYWVNIFKERVHVLYQHSLLIDKYKSKVSWCVRYGGSEEDMAKSNEEIQPAYLSVLKKYYPNMEVKWCVVFREKYSEPIYDKEYLSYCPKYRTPVQGFYNSGIQVTFPKIRNMNTALESGIRVAEIVAEDIGRNTV